MDRRKTAYSSLAVLLIVACAVISTPSASAEPGNGDHLETSGLTVIADTASVPGHMLDAYATALVIAENQPDDFGYPAIQNDQVVLPAVSVATSKLQLSDADAVKKLIEYSTVWFEDDTIAFSADMEVLKRISLVAALEERSVRQLDIIKNDLFDSRNEPPLTGADIRTTGIDGSGRVVVTVRQLSPEMTSEIAVKYGVNDVVILVQSELSSSISSRESDSSPYYGGARINAPGGCTSGFSWYSGTTSMMVTAGHCSPSGGTVTAPSGAIMGSITSGSRENWNTGVGTVYMTGSTTYRGDIALAEFNTGVGSSASIFTGSSTSNTSALVGEMWSRSPANGDQFCTGGSRSGEICGWTVAEININHAYDDGTTLRDGTRGSRTALSGIIPGDSGGPVYTVRSDGKVAAKGIISGQSSTLLSRSVYFTDIWHAYIGFPGYLRVS